VCAPGSVFALLVDDEVVLQRRSRSPVARRIAASVPAGIVSESLPATVTVRAPSRSAKSRVNPPRQAVAVSPLRTERLDAPSADIAPGASQLARKRASGRAKCGYRTLRVMTELRSTESRQPLRPAHESRSEPLPPCTRDHHSAHRGLLLSDDLERSLLAHSGWAAEPGHSHLAATSTQRGTRRMARAAHGAGHRIRDRVTTRRLVAGGSGTSVGAANRRAGVRKRWLGRVLRAMLGS
jgi:hypothetical protein